MTLALRDSRILVAPRKVVRLLKQTVFKRTPKAAAPARVGFLAAWERSMAHQIDLMMLDE